MSFRKDLFGLDEVGAELESMGVPRWHLVLLADLQRDVLHAVVEFPAYRGAYTLIPSSTWREINVVRQFKAPGRRGWRGEFDYSLTVNDFFGQEEQLLQKAVRAAARRDLIVMPTEFRRHMEQNGLLKLDMTEEEWQAALTWLLDSWKQLSGLDGNDCLYPMIEAHRMSAYLHAVKSDRERSGRMTGGKHAGGRPESPHWPAILEAAVRKLECRSARLQNGEVQEFAGHLHTAVKKTIPEGKDPLPNTETIAQRLRRILKQGGNED
jgi:hypothetical protein